MNNIIFTALKLFIILTIITGLIYPFTITFIAQTILPYQANGSIIKINQISAGSELIAQKFQKPIYFWPRPSACDYSALPSGATNLGPLSAGLKKSFNERLNFFCAANEISTAEAILKANEMLFASGSGVDPHISLSSALIQSKRVATARKYDAEKNLKIQQLILANSEPPQFGFLGEARINVLKLNISIDNLK